MSVFLPLISWTFFSYYSVESKCTLIDEKVIFIGEKKLENNNFPHVDVGILIPKMDLIYLPCDLQLKKQRHYLFKCPPPHTLVCVCMNVWWLVPLSSFFIQLSASLDTKLHW